MKRYIVVDVDGVLNSFAPTETSFPAVGIVEGFAYPLNLDKNHAEWLVKLAEETDSELIWGTTWVEYANDQIGKQIGLPEMVVPPTLRKFSESTVSWKSRTILSYVKDDHFVWFDDEFGLGMAIKGSNGLVIEVEPHRGLTKEHIDKARAVLLAWKEEDDTN